RLDMKIGYIGLGAMGGPMTRRLAEAHRGDVFAFDVDEATLARVAGETGAQPAASLADIAGACDILFSCLPNDDVLQSVYLGDAGIASAIRDGAITIDCSTVSPDATRKVHGVLAGRGASHLDASMLGSVKQANEGTISFVVGGDADAFERARPVLAVCGGLIRHCGGSGAGNHMKLIHQSLVAGHAVAVAEAMGLCLETGADIETFYEIVTEGTGFAYSRYFENRVPRMRDGDFSALFMLKFMLKDARLARDMVEGADTKFPALTSVIKTLEEAEAEGWGEADFSAAMKAIEARIGRQIESKS
ncbi:MAG: NAD(P)-dependent oxidoreductase, partial [Aestuariivirgaceae bacterium]